jgi:hypothetical protein
MALTDTQRDALRDALRHAVVDTIDQLDADTLRVSIDVIESDAHAPDHPHVVARASFRIGPDPADDRVDDGAATVPSPRDPAGRHSADVRGA